jgi:hypothetical protein
VLRPDTALARRVNADPDNLERDLAQLVMTTGCGANRGSLSRAPDRAVYAPWVRRRGVSSERALRAFVDG